jgi:predicted dehydrogenase
LRRSALAAGALGAGRLLTAPNVVHAANRGDKARCVLIGCGGRGQDHLKALLGQHLTALVDVDEKRLQHYQKLIAGKTGDGGQVQTFTDYRPMFDKIGKDIDAVSIATPNHQHALPALMAMALGKAVYCEKPLCHDVAEARRLRQVAAQAKVATQMGNQGHCMEGYRRLCEYIWAGAIGNITETHSWCDRSNGGSGPRPATLPVPAGMHWDEWIGPAPYRDFHSDLVPHEWHGWYDFGNGSLGNMCCHVLDGVYWALKVEHPTAVECEQIWGGSDERAPIGCRLRWDVPARGNLPAFKAYWYDGFESGKRVEKGDRAEHHLPPLLKELRAKYPGEMKDSNGTLYVGDKGIFYTGTYGGGFTTVPAIAFDRLPAPAKTLDRPKDPFANFYKAVTSGSTETATPFEYGARLTEFCLLGNLAMHAGAGHKVEWDGPNAKVTNLDGLNAFVTRAYRKGWG